MAKEKHKKIGRPEQKKDPRQELQEKYIEMQLLKQQITSYVEQKQAIDEKQNELNSTVEALQKLSSVKKGEEMWSSLGSGTFVRSDIKDIEKVLVAIGAGVVTKETITRAIEILQSRANDLENLSNEIVKEANRLVERINELEPELEKLAGEVKE